TIAPMPDASAAKKTTPAAPLRCARPPRSAPRTDGGFRHRSVRPEIAARLETRQTARSPRFAQPLFWRSRCATLFAYDCQKRARHHRERDMPIPSRPGADFVVVEADLAFADLNTLFDRPALAGYL